MDDSRVQIAPPPASPSPWGTGSTIDGPTPAPPPVADGPAPWSLIDTTVPTAGPTAPPVSTPWSAAPTVAPPPAPADPPPPWQPATQWTPAPYAPAPNTGRPVDAPSPSTGKSKSTSTTTVLVIMLAVAFSTVAGLNSGDDDTTTTTYAPTMTAPVAASVDPNDASAHPADRADAVQWAPQSTGSGGLRVDFPGPVLRSERRGEAGQPVIRMMDGMAVDTNVSVVDYDFTDTGVDPATRTDEQLIADHTVGLGAATGSVAENSPIGPVVRFDFSGTGNNVDTVGVGRIYRSGQHVFVIQIFTQTRTPDSPLMDPGLIDLRMWKSASPAP